MASTTVLETLRRQAEAEMRRPAPDLSGSHSLKRRKLEDGAVRLDSVGRYDYGAAGAITGPGLVVHCSFKREISATREATSVLFPYLQAAAAVAAAATADTARAVPVDVQQSGACTERGSDASGLEKPAEVTATGTALADAEKTAAAATEPDQTPALIKGGASSTDVDASTPPSALQVLPDSDVANITALPEADAGRSAPAVEQSRESNAAATAQDRSDLTAGIALIPVKLSCSGLLLLRLRGCAAGVATAAVEALLRDITAKRRPALQHCQRVTPAEVVVAAPSLDSLQLAAQETASAWLQGQLGASSRSAYAVAYKHRSPAPLGQLEMQTPSAELGQRVPALVERAATLSTEPEQPDQLQHGGGNVGTISDLSNKPQRAGIALERGAAIAALAAGAAASLRELGADANVDLKSPAWALVAEALPVKAAPGGLVVTLAAVPVECLRLKPRLTIMPSATVT